MAMDNARSARAMGLGGSTDRLPGKTADDIGPIRIDAGSVAEMTRPSGVQSVLVTNPQAPNVTVHAPITINGVADGTAAGNAAAAQLGSEVKSAVESSYGGPF
jgi:phage tail sheath protein FI